MRIRFRSLVLVLMICACFFPIGLKAQAVNSVESTPLITVLSFLEKKYDILFSYNAEVVSLMKTEVSYENMPLEECLQEIATGVGLEIEKASGKYYLIRQKEKRYCIDTHDEDAVVSSDLINVFINDEPAKKLSGDSTSLSFFDYTLDVKDTIRVYTYGYHIHSFPAIDLLNTACIQVQLTPNPILLKDVIIENYMVRGVNANLDDQSLEIDMDNLALLPGETDRDILESIKTLPGINSPDTRAGNIFIRGSSTDQSLVLYDNIHIYHKGHYFGTISPYNSKVVGGIDVYRNGFQPRLGGRVGGAVKIRSTDNVLKKARYGAGINSMNAVAYAAVPLVKDKLGIIIGARKSFPRSIESPKLNAISDMVFNTKSIIDVQNRPDVELKEFRVDYSDITAKVLFKPDDKNQLSLSGLFVYNELRHYVEDQRAGTNSEEYSQLDNYGLNFTWSSKLSSKVHSLLDLTLSDYEFNYLTRKREQSSGDRVAQTDLSNTLSDFSARYEVEFALGKNNNLQSGIELKSQQTFFSVTNYSEVGQPIDDDFRQEENGISYSPYINYELRRFKKLNIQLGIRGTYFDKQSDFRLAPRVFANYGISDALNLKGSFGLYNQYLAKIQNLRLFSSGGLDNELLMLANTENVGIMDGQQSMLGLMYSKDDWLLDVEFYNKRTENITFVPNTKFAIGGDYISGDMTSKGVDVLLKKTFSSKFTAWASYSLSRSRILYDSLGAEELFSINDQPHILKLVGVYSTNRWNISLGWKVMSGLYAQFPIFKKPFVPSLNQNKNPLPSNTGLALEEGESLTPYTEQRYPMMHMLDASISYRLNKKRGAKWNGHIGLSILNIYNQKNIIEEVSKFEADGTEVFSYGYSIGFAPNVMLMIEW
ncbi:MAG: hypothetical protein ACJA2S_002957 [Cyclobacteriaceae bacterium]